MATTIKTKEQAVYDSKMEKLDEFEKRATVALADYKKLWTALGSLEDDLSNDFGILHEELDCYESDEFTSRDFDEIDTSLEATINHIHMVRQDLQKKHNASKLHEDAYGYMLAKGKLYSCFTTYPPSGYLDLSMDEINKFYEMCCEISKESKDDFVKAITKEYEK